METQKISIDISDDLYYRLKKDALEKRTTMSEILRALIEKKYGGKNEKKS